MKTSVFLFALSLVLFIGCTKDEIQQAESPDLKCAKITEQKDRDRDGDRKKDKDDEQNRHKKVKSLKADFCFTPDMGATPMLIVGLDPNNPASYLPGAGSISGTASYGDEMQPIEGIMTAVSANFDFTKGLIVWVTKGKITYPNGDYYYFVATSNTNPADGTFTGPVYMHDGVGKFKGAKGEVQMTGQGLCWTAEGYMKYAR